MGKLKRGKVILAVAITIAVIIGMGSIIAGIKSIKGLTNYFTIKPEDVPAEEYTITGEIIGNLSEHGTIYGVPQTVEGGDDADLISVEVDGGYTISSIRLYSGAEIDGVYSENDTDGISWSKWYNRRTGKYEIETIEEVDANKHVVIVLKEASTVAQIVTVPEDNETLAQMKSLLGDEIDILGHEYESLEDAINDAEYVNQKRDELGLEGTVEIKILVNIDNIEANQIEDHNDVVLDLNGKTITGDYTDVAVITIEKGGSLQVIDRTDGTDDDNIGTIRNETGVAIQIEKGAELTLGEDDGLTTVSQTCPVIEGGTYGIYKEEQNGEEGTFNFYDGKVIGNTAGTIETPSSMGGGTIVDDKPALYDTSDENVMVGDIETVEKTLQRDNEIEALVNESRYYQIQKAFADVNNGVYGNDVEIDLVKNASLDDIDFTDGSIPNQIIVNQGKNVVLDLNGNYLSGNASNYLIKSSGNLEIIDSTTDKKGTVKFTLEKYSDDDQYYFVNNRNYIEANNYNTETSNENEKACGYIKIDLTNANSEDTFTFSLLATNAHYIITETPEKPSTYSKSTYYSTILDYTNNEELNGGKIYYMHLKDSDHSNYSIMQIYQIRLINNTTNEKYFAVDNAKGQIAYTSARPAILVEDTGNVKVSNIALVKTGDNTTYIQNSGNLEINKSLINAQVYHYGDEEFKGSNSYIETVYNGTLSRTNTTYKNNNATINNCFVKASNYSEENLNINNSYVILASIAKGKFNANNCYISVSKIGNNISESISLKNCMCYAYTGATKKLLIQDCYFPYISRYGNNTMNITEDTEECKIINSNFDSVDIITKTQNAVYTNNTMTLAYIQNYGNLNIDGGTYVSKLANYECFVLYGNSVTTINNCEIINRIANKAAIRGSVTSAEEQNPKVILGLKNTQENKQVSTTTPSITSNTGKGITGCDIYFYDGIISALKDKPVEGSNIIEIEEQDEQGRKLSINSAMENVSEKVIEKLTLQSGTTVARIAKTADINLNNIIHEDDGEYYNFYCLEDAIAVCKNSVNTTIQITSNINETSEIIIPQAKDIKLDLNGKIIKSFSKNNLIENNGKLEVTDTTSGKNGELFAYETVITNTENAELILDECQINNSRSVRAFDNPFSTAKSHYKYIENSGTITINGLKKGTETDTIYNTGIINCYEGGIIVNNLESAQLNVIGEDAYVGLVLNNDQSKVSVTKGYAKIYNESTANNALAITNGTVDITNNANANINIEQTGSNSISLTLKNTPTENTVTLTNINTITVDSNSKTLITNCKEIAQAFVGANSTITATQGVASTATGLIKSEKDGEINISNIDVNGAISYSGAGTMNIENVEIHTSSTSIYNVGAGTIKISSEGNKTIQSDNDIAITNTGAGTITIGEKDGIANEYPHIIGKKTGVKIASGRLEYFDGTIIGKTQYNVNNTRVEADALILNGEAEYESNHDIKKEVLIRQNEENENLVDYKETVTLIKEGIAKVNENNVDTNNLVQGEYEKSGEDYIFYSLQNAVNACKNNLQNSATITILKDITLSESTEVLATKNITIDINGFEITSSVQNAIINNGTLEIINSSISGGNIKIATAQMLNNKGTATIDNVTIESTIVNTSTTRVDMFVNEGTLNLQGNYSSPNINVRSYNVSFAYLNIVNNKENATLNISNLAIKSPETSSAVVDFSKVNICENYGEVIINNALIVSQNIVNQANGTMTINNSILNCKATNYGENIRNNSNKKYVEGESQAAITMYNTIISGSVKIANNAGEIIIDGANNCNIDSINITNATNADATIKNLTMTGNLTNNANANMNLENVVFYSNRAVSYNYGNMTIIGGEIEGNSYGRLNNKAALTLGKNDNTIEATPTITAADLGSFKYYDGTIVTGIPTDSNYTSFKGRIEDIPNEYEVCFEENDNQRIYTLNKVIVATIGEQPNQQTFTTLKAAFDACTTSNNTTIKLQKNIAINSKCYYEIAENTDVTLDLNGKKVWTYSNNDQIFLVNGKFEIKDSAENGELIQGIESTPYPNKQSLIVAYGDVTINGGKYACGYNVIYARPQVNKEYNILINGGTYKTTSSECYLFKGGSGVVGSKITVNITGDVNAVSDYIYIDSGTEMKIDGENISLGIIRVCNSAKLEVLKDKVISTIVNFYGNTVLENAAIVSIYNGYNTNYGATPSTTGTIMKISNNTIIGSIKNNAPLTIEDSIVARNIEQTSIGVIEIKDNVIINPANDATLITDSQFRSYYSSAQQNIGIKGGTVKLGIKDYKMFKDIIKVYGKQYGIDLAQLYMYDGTIYGGTKAISSSVNVAELETFYQIEAADEGKEEYLELVGTIDNKAELATGGTYKTVKLALNAIENTTNKTGTINLINTNTVIDNVEEIIEINNGMDITINLNGQGIVGLLENSPVIKVHSGGKLRIIGASSYGVENKLGLAIENAGTLILGDETDSTVNANTPIIKGETNAINNTGTIEFYDGILKAINAVIDGTPISTYLSGYNLTSGQETIDEVEYNTLKLTN